MKLVQRTDDVLYKLLKEFRVFRIYHYDEELDYIELTEKEHQELLDKRDDIFCDHKIKTIRNEEKLVEFQGFPVKVVTNIKSF